MQSITQMYLKNEYLPINYRKKYRVCDFVLLKNNIRGTMPNHFLIGRFSTWFGGLLMFPEYLFE